jgi:hypothetical protein
MRKAFEVGGVIAAAVLIAFGIATLVIGVDGRSTVRHEIGLQQIVGTPDMSPSGIAAEVKAIQQSQQQLLAAQTKAGLPAAQRYVMTPVSAPSCSVAGKTIDNGARARCFAEYMRIHSLGSTGGLVYAQMGRYQALAGAPLKATDFAGGTNDPTAAVIDPKTHQPVDNGRRDLWVTETALSTALNTSYMAEQISLFGVVVGVALFLSGLGFGILAIGGALRNPETALTFLRRYHAKTTPVTSS